MANYSKTSLSKSFFSSTIIIISLILLPPLLANFLLNSNKKKIEQILDNKVLIASLYYLPPSTIVLNDTSVIIDSRLKDNQQLFVKKSKLKFSLEQLLAERKFRIIEVDLDGLRLDYIDYLISPEEIINAAKKIIKSLDENQTYKLSMKNGLFALPPHSGASGYLAADLNLEIQSNKFASCRGSFSLTASALKEDINERRLNYNLRLSFKKEGLDIEVAELQKDNFNLSLWGAASGNLLRLNGNLLSLKPAEAALKKKTFFKIPPKINDKLKEMFAFLRKDKLLVPKFIGPSKSGLNIFDLGCLVQFNPNGFQIKNLTFSLCDIPFSIKGDIPVSSAGPIALELFSFPNQPEEKRSENPQRFNLKLKGNLEETKFNGRLDFEFMRNLKTRQSLQKIGSSFKNLNFDFAAFRWLRVSFDEAGVSYQADENIYNIAFNDFNCLFNPAQKKAKFNCAVYDGYLEGEALFDLAKFPFKAAVKSNINDVNANQLSSLSEYFSKVYGTLSAKVNYENYPVSNLSGHLSIRRGYLDNLRFFSWLADFFRMEALKKVNFEEISSDFLLDDKVSALENIKLDSSEVELKGYFNISTDDLVSGNLSLILSDKLLDSSPKFQRLLRLIGSDLSTVSFDFQMSGLYENMNFKWLDSEFKNGLKKLLPQGMEQKIEAEIESAIESISAQQ